MRLTRATRALRSRGRKALVAFFTAGYPDDETFAALVRAAASAGADVVEVGIPFSDPIADGPVIQASSAAALARGMTLGRALDACASLTRDLDVPIVAMSYASPILALGVERFAREAADAGIAGAILPDVSHEESGAFRPALAEAGLALVDFVAPTSGDDRIRTVARDAEGFIYLVSLTGVTGASGAAADGLAPLVVRVRAASETPVYVGFGISTAGQAAAVTATADGVIIGTRLVQLAAGDDAVDRVGAFLGGVRRALDGGGAEC